MAHEHKEPAMGTYYMVFIGIAVMTLANIGISFLEASGPVRAMMNFGIATVQAVLLAYYFMHVKAADKVTWIVIAAGMFWLFLLFVLILTDYVTRQYGVY